MQQAELIDEYAAGPKLLREATAGMTREQLLARPVAGKWSTLEVICHLADFEIVYADRMKRVIAENEPTMFGGDPDVFASRLAYQSRDLEEELRLIQSVRGQVARILRTLNEDDFSRVGNHSEAGRLTLLALLERVSGHVTHHVKFIEEKRKALGI
jgi:DinB family protein